MPAGNELEHYLAAVPEPRRQRILAIRDAFRAELDGVDGPDVAVAHSGAEYVSVLLNLCDP